MKNNIRLKEKIDALKVCYSNVHASFSVSADDKLLRSKKILAAHILELEKTHTEQLQVFLEEEE